MQTEIEPFIIVLNSLIKKVNISTFPVYQASHSGNRGIKVPIMNSTIKHLIRWIMLLFLIAGCGVPADTLAPTQTNVPTQNLGGLSPDAVASLNSLRNLDDYPFYVMHYSGGYDYPRTSLPQVDSSGIGCSLFAALGETGDKYFGRNFDWAFSPALLLFADPPDGYASASMVDLTFLGIDPESAKRLSDLPLEERKALLAAPSLPFDGMNEYGLAIGMAAIPEEYADDASYQASRPTIGSIGIIRQVLDHARNVDEAIDIFGKYNLDFSGGPPIHYLLADSSGKAVLVEYYQGKMITLPNEDAWHMATNHLRCVAEGDGGCWRYRTLSERLTERGGQLDAQSAMQLLSEVKQDVTQWSAVYNMTSGDIQVVIGGAYQTSYAFHLDIIKQ